MAPIQTFDHNGATNARLPEGFGARRPRPEDAAAVSAVMSATETARANAPETTVEDVEVWWRQLEPSTNAWLITYGGERVVAYVDVVRRSDEEYLADGYVHPDFTNRGLGRYLVRLSEAAAGAGGASRLRNGVLASDVRAVRLLEAESYQPVRHFYRMALDLPIPLYEPAWPEGLTVTTPTRAQLPAVHATISEAFAEEWDFTPDTFEEWLKRKESEGLDLALCFTAWENDEIAGVVQCSRRFDAGWVNALAVRTPWRRRGLGHALLARAIQEMSRRGEKRVALGVDAANSTGATRLYERAGMDIEFEAIIYAKTL
jgi:mycothiol synthase